MDITKSSEIELKALAFDQLVAMETAQKNLQLINQQLQVFAHGNTSKVEALETTVVEEVLSEEVV